MPYIDKLLDVLRQRGRIRFAYRRGSTAEDPPARRRHANPHRAGRAGTRRSSMLSEICRPEGLGAFSRNTATSISAYEMDEKSRFRCNLPQADATATAAVFRLIPTQIAVARRARHSARRQGNSATCAAASSSSPARPAPAKSTTLAALIDYINTNFARHIITIAGADRVRAQQQAQHHHPARSAGAFLDLPGGPESRPARGLRHRARRRNARSRNHLSSRSPPPRPACSSSARCTPTTPAKPSTA